MATNDDLMAAGLYYNEPRQGAPDYVLGSLSVHRERFIAWINRHEIDEKGYIKIDVLRAKSSGKVYCKINDWKPGNQASTRSSVKPELSPETQRAVDEFGGTVDDDPVSF